MTEADSIKWALLDLLKVLDAEYGGRLHGEFARIARTLGVELPPIASPSITWSEDPVEWTREHNFKAQAEADNNWKAEQARKLKAPRN